MSTFINLAGVGARHATHLQALAEELGKPIVMVPGGGRARPFDPRNADNWAQHAPRTNAAVLELEGGFDRLVNEGIMIFNWAGKHARFMDYQAEPFPGSLWSDGTGRQSDMRDFMCDYHPYRRGRVAPDGMPQHTHDPSRYTTTEMVKVPDTDYLIGEVAERVVWYHYAVEYILEQRRFNVELWYDHAIRRAIDPEFTTQLAERVAEASRNAFVAFMGEGRMSRRVQNLRQTIEQNENNINNYRSSIATSLRQLSESQNELDTLLTLIGQGDISWDEYWERLVNHPRITAIEWEEPTLTFRTDEIFLSHPTAGTRASLGVMEIKLNLRDHYITIVNTTNPRGNRAHPHVNGDAPCFGQWEHAIYQLLADGNIYDLMEMMFVYLESFNPRDDWGRFAAYWFRTDGSPIDNADTDAAVEAAANGTPLGAEDEEQETVEA